MLLFQSVAARCLWSCVLAGVFWRSAAQFPSLPDPNAAQYNCPEGWTYNTGSCYRLLNITLSRNNAQGACARYGARLADVQGYGETRFVSSLVSQAGADVTDVWIGYKLDNSDGRYAGQWAPNQPNPDLSCTSVSVQEAQWYTRPCQTSLFGVCKADACLQGQFRCVSGRCIPGAARCDGTPDCEDGTDEVNCAGCGGTLTGTSGTIQSPGYPQEYNTSLDCLWIIQTEEGQRLNLTFKDFELEDELDTLTISSQPFREETSTLLSGDTSNPGSIVISSNIALVRLRTDWNGAARGFQLDWQAFEVGGCGGQLTVSPEVDIALPGAPGLDCEWVLSAPAGDVITLTLQNGQLAGHDSYVEIYDGESTAAPSLGKFGAGHISGIVTGTSNKMAVKMITSNAKQQGLTARAVTGCQLTLSDVVYGKLSIGTDPYKSGVDCTYTVQSSQSQPLLLSPGDIDEGDVLQVQPDDGSAVNYNNNNLPPSIRAEGGTFRINYVSEGNPLMATFSVDCPDPQTVLSGSTEPVTIVGNSTEYGAVAKLRCRDGYVSDHFNGSLTLQCRNGGVWKEVSTAKLMDMAIPDGLCKALDCGEPPVIPQGYYIKSGETMFRSSMTYTCFSSELMLIGDSNITCLESGQWSQPPLCQDPACALSVRDGTLMVERGDRRADQFSSGAVVKVKCDPGFEPNGTDESFCQLGTWKHNKGSAPQCKRRKCAMPSMENLDVNPMDEYYAGDMVIFNCSTGYSPNSTDNLTLTCNNDGVFVGSSTNCTDVDECSAGRHQCSDNTVCVNTEGSYWCQCLPGYYKDQPMDRMCVDMDECAVNNGGCSDTCTNFAGGHNCTCTRPGHQLFTFNGQYGVSVREGETGYDVTDILRFNQSCVSVPCGPLPNLTNGFYNDFKSGSYFYGDNITYHCEKGYMMTGDPTFTCGMETENDLPTCNVALCPTLETIKNGTVSAPTRPAYGSNVTYTCDEGFVLVGSGTRYCDNIGAGDNVTYGWTGMQPMCHLVDCLGLPLPPGGLLLNTSSPNTTYGSVQTVGCLPGFQLRGDKQHVCQASGRWSGNATRCIPTSCPDPGTPAGGQQDVSNYDVGTVMTFSCNRTGYGPSHSQGLLCHLPEGAVDPVFNGTIPECVDVEPPDFGDSCPPQISVDLGPYGFLPTVFYPPNATDNSGEQIQVISDPPGFFGIDLLPNDTDVLMFKATDTSNRTSVCAIQLVVNDVVLPTIECPTNQPVPFNGTSATYQLTAIATDNVQIARITYQPAADGVIRYGEVVYVQATAYDTSNNNASCVFTVQARAPACSEDSLYIPESVQKNYMGLVQADNVYKYEVSCPQSMAFAEGDIEETTRTYTCTVEDGWQIEGRTASYVPGCTDKTAADQQMGFMVTMATTNANIPSACASHYQTSVSSYNIEDNLQANLQQKCRQIPVPDVTVLLTGHSVSLQQSDLTINFTIRVSPNSASTPEDHVISCLTSLRNTIAGVPGAEVPEPNTSYRFRTWLDNVQSGTVGGTQCPSLTRAAAPSVAPEYLRDGDSQSAAVCNIGESPVSGFCLPCTPGTYQAVLNGPCISCPAGSYQNTSRAVSCHSCPPATWTARHNSWSRDACVDTCPMGQYSTTRVSPCDSCPRGTYSGQLGTERCTNCPNGTTTLEVGQTSIYACRRG
ncbi:sushi, von Willebrand factor type A, EGF and pentraxin domain-containing protein 1-like [Branchiostoma floridae]|uniref:Sushi, von Willebrand factor type A, EGF and pentraxin domain-containing protein 1-like n=1 Tax=Branchiostoma floridae TaxID=7739 RepID=A0A9J7MK18_BRAFL|nr:sushi, von Willebrand factor type A, EGF and pentraxin domain-containing protein 1-like [Branchiostoma floridae]